MKLEEAYLLEILGNHINGTESSLRMKNSPGVEDNLFSKGNLQGDIDWDRLIELAQSHQVEAILYAQCRAFLPEQYSPHLVKQHAMSVSRFVRRREMMRCLEDALNKEGIEYLLVKGPEVAACYPTPYLRTMGDIDIVVHGCDKEKGHRMLLDMGFYIVKIEDREWVYGKDDLEVELHDHLFYEQVVNNEAMMDFSEKVWEYTRKVEASAAPDKEVGFALNTERGFAADDEAGSTPGVLRSLDPGAEAVGDSGVDMDGESLRRVLDWNYHFVFLVAHLKEHFLADGVGLRQFMDLVVVMRQQELDFAWISRELEKMGLLAFGKTCLGLCENWFDVRLPFGETVAPRLSEEVAAYVMSNGAFGFQNDENTVRTRIQQNGRWKALFLTAFPPYGEVCQYDYCTFVRGKPWLLPAAWIYRVWHGLRNGKASLAKQMAGAMVSDQMFDRRKQLLEKVGLE